MSAPVPATDGFAPNLPHQFGDYELQAEIGRGGMGIIYQARQCCLDRPCAVKMLRPGRGGSGSADEESLRAEANAAASLDHPNIVGIYEVGREQGQLFFSMELVDGPNLTRYAGTRLLTPSAIARLVKTVAEAIAYAHRRGVVHHDLKPANILIDPSDEPQITDFGLARRIDEDRDHDPARGAGTPNYLAPEQASARFGEPDRRTDVYGLGAILYFLLTDRPPFSGVTPEVTIQSVLNDDPVRPRLLRPGTSADLENICLKCLAKSPARRYAAATEVADELQRFLEDRPIQARPAGWMERGRKWCRRHPAIAALGSVVALLLVVIATVSSTAALRIEQARRRARASELEARRNLYDADMLLAAAAYAGGRDAQVRELLRHHRPTDPEAPDLRGWEWRFLDHATLPDIDGVLGRVSNAVAQIETSPDGRHLIASDTSGRLHCWDLASRQQLASAVIRPVGPPIFTLARHHDWILTSTQSRTGITTTVLLLQRPSLDVVREIPIPERGSIAAFNEAEDQFWLIGTEALIAYHLETGTESARHALPHSQAVRWRNLAISPDRRLAALAEDQGRIHLIDLARGTTVATFDGHAFQPVWGTAVYSIAFSNDGQLLISAGTDGTVRVWDAANHRPLRTLSGHTGLVMSAVASPDGQWVLSGGEDSYLLLASLGPSAESIRLRGADAVQTVVAFLPDQETPVSGGLDGTIQLWRPRPRVESPWQTNLPPDTSAVEHLGTEFYVALRTDAGSSVHRLSDGAPVFRMPGRTEATAGTSGRLPDGTFVGATFSPDGSLRVRRGSDDREREVRIPLPRPLPPRAVSFTAISPDGTWLAVGDLLNGIRLLEVESLAERLSLPGNPRFIQFSPSGRLLVVGQVAGPVHVWSIPDGQSRAETLHHPHIAAAAFSPDESKLATVAFDGAARLWDLVSGRELARLASSAGNLCAVTWGADGSRLFAASLRGVVVAWDLATQRETFLNPAHSQPVTDLVSRPDGTLVSFAPDGIRLWPAPAESVEPTLPAVGEHRLGSP